MAYTSPYERKFGKKHPNNPAERKRKQKKAAITTPDQKKQKPDSSNRNALAIFRLAKAAKKSLGASSKTREAESEKTFALRDKLYDKREKRRRK